MMCYPNDYAIKSIQEQRMKQYVREAEIDHLVSEINLHQPGLLSRQARRLLHGLGHFLLATGKQLDRFETPMATIPQEQ